MYQYPVYEYGTAVPVFVLVQNLYKSERCALHKVRGGRYCSTRTGLLAHASECDITAECNLFPPSLTLTLTLSGLLYNKVQMDKIA